MASDSEITGRFIVEWKPQRYDFPSRRNQQHRHDGYRSTMTRNAHRVFFHDATDANEATKDVVWGAADLGRPLLEENSRRSVAKYLRTSSFTRKAVRILTHYEDHGSFVCGEPGVDHAGR